MLGHLALGVVILAVAVGTVRVACALHESETGLGAVGEVLVSVLATWVALSVAAVGGLLLGIGVVASWAFVAILTIGIGAFVSPPSINAIRSLGSRVVAELRSRWLLWIFAGLLILTQMVLTTLSIRNFGDIGWDASWYHLPMVGSMIQEGSLFGWPNLNPFMYYPGLVESQGTLLGAGLGSVGAASFVQLPYWTWLILFVAGFISHRSNSLVTVSAILAIAAIPTGWLQPRTLYVDVALGVMLTTALVTAVLAWQFSNRLLLVISALLAGGVFATKLGGSGAIPVAIVIAGVALSSGRMRRVAVAVAVSGVIAVSPFLARNAIEWGNPLYPLDVTETLQRAGTPEHSRPPFSMAEMRFFSDTAQRPDSLLSLSTLAAVAKSYAVLPVQETWRLVGDRATPPKRGIYRYDSREGGFGTAWLVLLAVSGIVVVATMVGDPRWKRARKSTGAFVGLVVLLAAASFALTQAPWWPRYALGAGFSLAIAAAIVIGRYRWSSIATAVLVIPLALISINVAEQHGGVPFWTDAVPAAEADLIQSTGLNVFTPPYAPIVLAEARSVAVVVSSPQFPAGLWGGHWAIDVSVVGNGGVTGTASGACPDAVLTSDPEAAFAFLSAIGASSGELTPWQGRYEPMLWFTGISCPDEAR